MCVCVVASLYVDIFVCCTAVCRCVCVLHHCMLMCLCVVAPLCVDVYVCCTAVCRCACVLLHCCVSMCVCVSPLCVDVFVCCTAVCRCVSVFHCCVSMCVFHCCVSMCVCVAPLYVDVFVCCCTAVCRCVCVLHCCVSMCVCVAPLYVDVFVCCTAVCWCVFSEEEVARLSSVAVSAEVIRAASLPMQLNHSVSSGSDVSSHKTTKKHKHKRPVKVSVSSELCDVGPRCHEVREQGSKSGRHRTKHKRHAGDMGKSRATGLCDGVKCRKVNKRGRVTDWRTAAAVNWGSSEWFGEEEHDGSECCETRSVRWSHDAAELSVIGAAVRHRTSTLRWPTVAMTVTVIDWYAEMLPLVQWSDLGRLALCTECGGHHHGLACHRHVIWCLYNDLFTDEGQVLVCVSADMCVSIYDWSSHIHISDNLTFTDEFTAAQSHCLFLSDVLCLLWPPYVIGQAIYIFILWFLRLSFFLFFLT